MSATQWPRLPPEGKASQEATGCGPAGWLGLPWIGNPATHWPACPAAAMRGETGRIGGYGSDERDRSQTCPNGSRIFAVWSGRSGAVGWRIGVAPAATMRSKRATTSSVSRSR